MVEWAGCALTCLHILHVEVQVAGDLRHEHRLVAGRALLLPPASGINSSTGCSS